MLSIGIGEGVVTLVSMGVFVRLNRVTNRIVVFLMWATSMWVYQGGSLP